MNLTELINECIRIKPGNKEFALFFDGQSEWDAHIGNRSLMVRLGESGGEFSELGSTPEEAVRNLFEALRGVAEVVDAIAASAAGGGMNDIDWSKAPEGATHFQPRNEEADEMPAFWRVVDGVARDVWCFDDSLEFLRHHFKYGPKGCIGFHPEKCLERPQEWTGEGLPPVGAAVDCMCTAKTKARDWFPAEVKYISPYTVVLTDYSTEELDGEFVAHPATLNFRPIRTPEQIAAEEREKAIDEMYSLTRTSSSQEVIYAQRHVCEDLYDAGYRKTEAP